jgi:hypothetical protein
MAAGERRDGVRVLKPIPRAGAVWLEFSIDLRYRGDVKSLQRIVSRRREHLVQNMWGRL